MIFSKFKQFYIKYLSIFITRLVFSSPRKLISYSARNESIDIGKEDYQNQIKEVRKIKIGDAKCQDRMAKLKKDTENLLNLIKYEAIKIKLQSRIIESRNLVNKQDKILALREIKQDIRNLIIIYQNILDSNKQAEHIHKKKWQTLN